MESNRPLNVLVLANFNTGERFVRRCKERGAKVWLLTKAKFLNKPWARDALEDVFAEPDDSPLRHTIHTVSYLSRNRKFDRIVPFDDIEVEVAAMLRAHFCMDGMNETDARYFRDKLAMRVRAKREGIAVPDFVHVQHADEINAFCDRVAAPWMLKPRSEASATGIQKIHDKQQLWDAINKLGDRASFFLLEQFLPGDVHHVDSIVADGKIVFAECHRNGTPPWEISHGGGMFTTYTIARGGDDERALLAMNAKIIERFGLQRGIAHIEYIKGRDGKFYFLEAGARVGGAHVSDVVEASTGINLWSEWADLELDRDEHPYTLPANRKDYAGLLQTLAKQERPDLSAYNDPEVVYRTDDKHHAGLIVRSNTFDRVEELLRSYAPRFAKDFATSMPHYELPPLR
ncbi:MAG: hypothetical protein U0269_22760 [Polyangiales bacterium]